MLKNMGKLQPSAVADTVGFTSLAVLRDLLELLILVSF